MPVSPDESGARRPAGGGHRPRRGALTAYLDAVIFVLGVWLVIASFAVHRETPVPLASRWSDVIVGGAIALLARFTFAIPTATLWINLAQIGLAMWLATSPVVLDVGAGSESTAGGWNDIAVSTALALLAGGSALLCRPVR